MERAKKKNIYRKLALSFKELERKLNDKLKKHVICLNTLVTQKTAKPRKKQKFSDLDYVMILPVERKKAETKEELTIRSKKKKKMRFKMLERFNPDEPTGDVFKDAWKEFFCYLDMMNKATEYFFASTLKQIMTRKDIAKKKERGKRIWMIKRKMNLDQKLKPNIKNMIYMYKEPRSDSEIVQESRSSDLNFQDKEETRTPHTFTIILIQNRYSKKSKSHMLKCLHKINYHPPPNTKKENHGDPSNRTLRKKMNNPNENLIWEKARVSHLFREDRIHTQNPNEDNIFKTKVNLEALHNTS
jgi:hypothetical protein